MSTTKTLQIRLDETEYQALQQLADADQTTLSDYCRQAIRMGVAAEQMAAVQAADNARRQIDRDVSRKLFALVTQCTMILHDLGAKAGVVIDDVRTEAQEYAAEQFLDGDALEQALLDAAKVEAANA